MSETSNQLVVNQLGYLPDGDKKAYWLNPSNELVSLVSMDPKGQAEKQVFTVSTEPQSNVINFSDITQPGWYQLQSNSTTSAPFQIVDNVYQGLTDRLVKALYLQRSGSVIKDQATGMSRPKSHIQDAVIFRTDDFHKVGTQLDMTGGWYDAGDYGKYVATTTITVARLLEAYNQAPDLFTAKNNTGSELPAVLDEAIYGLDWLSKMQREDGAVYRKVSGAKWPGKIVPWQDTQVRYIYGISTPETAKFAATMAFASRVLKPLRPNLARDYLKSAIHAWRYLEQQPEQYIDWQKGDDSGSGPYIKNAEDSEASLDTDVDDRLWALAELYLSTGQSKYRSRFNELYDKELVGIFEWKNPALMGIFHLIASEGTELTKQLMTDLQSVAKRYSDQSANSPFSIANQQFIWGSNKMTAEAGVLMASADASSHTNNYRSVVQSQIDYLLGANAFNMSFVTNTGTYAVRNLHHLYRISTGVSLPGFMVGGPNEKAQAGVAPKGEGMMSYVDSEKSYAVNEFAIDYNASLIGLLAVHHTYFN
ncbi:glycoside hydrolase family 9 protein [Moritella sp. 24]|nr:glycoside hydrolase family 9 protein [Moritella sp. 24]